MRGKGVLVTGLMIFFFTILTSRPVFSVNIDNCSVLDTPGKIYNLTQDVSDSSNTTCINIAADDVILECNGHEIDGVDGANTYGVRVTGRSNVTIRNCRISDWTYGIYLSSATGSHIYNNFITSNTDRGVNIVSSSNYNNFTNNTVFFNTNYGVVIVSSQYNNFSYGNVSNNTNHGIWLSSADNNRIEYSNINFNMQDGINLDSSDGNIIYENNITSNQARGVYVTSSSGNRIEGGNVRSNGNTGIWVYQSTNNNVSNLNSSLNTNNGVFLESSSNGNRVVDVVAVGNTGNGVYIESSSNNLILSVTSRSNSNGVLINYGSNNNLTGGDIRSNSNNGIRLTYTTNNFVRDTIINSSGGYEIYTSDTSSSHNYFTNTTFDKSDVSVDGNTIIWVRWYLQIEVRDTSENPVEGANVTVTDVYESVWFSGLTNSSGYTPLQILTEYNQTSSGKSFYTNYTVNVTKSGHPSNQTRLNITRSELLVIHLQSISPPSVEIKTYTQALAETSVFKPGRMVRIRADVTSAGGRDYLSNATVLIKDHLGNIMVNNVEMVNVSEITSGYVYEYNYTLPSNAQGLWSIRVTAMDEGNGEGYDSRKIAVSGVSIQVKLILNTTWNSADIYVPGIGEKSFEAFQTLSPHTDANPPHYYIASYLDDILISLVFSSGNPLSISASTEGGKYELQIDQRFPNFAAFLVFSRGNWRQVNQRIGMIEKEEFLSEISPSFSYGLGDKYKFRIELSYDNIDFNNTMSVGRGYSRILIENQGAAGDEVTINLTRV